MKKMSKDAEVQLIASFVRCFLDEMIAPNTPYPINIQNREDYEYLVIDAVLYAIDRPNRIETIVDDVLAIVHKVESYVDTKQVDPLHEGALVLAGSLTLGCLLGQEMASKAFHHQMEQMAICN